jgi:hypothetical protein
VHAALKSVIHDCASRVEPGQQRVYIELKLGVAKHDFQLLSHNSKPEKT